MLLYIDNGTTGNATIATCYYLTCYRRVLPDNDHDHYHNHCYYSVGYYASPLFEPKCVVHLMGTSKFL